MMQTFNEKQKLNDSATRLFVKKLMQFQTVCLEIYPAAKPPTNHPKPVEKVKVFRTLHNQQPEVENT
jgi:hypothetical protein